MEIKDIYRGRAQRALRAFLGVRGASSSPMPESEGPADLS